MSNKQSLSLGERKAIARKWFAPTADDISEAMNAPVLTMVDDLLGRKSENVEWLEQIHREAGEPNKQPASNHDD